MKKTILYVSLTLAMYSSHVSAKEVFTVDQLILESLKNAPDLQISKLQYDASTSRYNTASSEYLPSVNLTASTGRVAQSAIFNANGDVQNNILKGELSLKQLLYDFGKTQGRTATQKFAADSYSMQNMQNIANKKQNVKSAYYDVLKSLALINVQKENVQLNKAQLYRSKRYFQAGIRTKIDVSDAKVQLIQAKLDLKTAEYNLKLSYANLDKIVGFTALENDYAVYSKKLELDKLYQSLKEYDLNLHNAILYAYQNRFDIKKEQALMQSKQADIRTTKAEYYPALYLGANYLYQKAQSKELQLFLPETQWSAMLNLNWNIYQGGATDSKTQEKSINATISSVQLANTKLIIKASVTDAYINVYKSKDTVELAQSLVDISNEKFDQASKRYEHGLSDYIELQEARQGYINSKAILVVDYYDYYIAVAKLDNAIGK